MGQLKRGDPPPTRSRSIDVLFLEAIERGISSCQRQLDQVAILAARSVT